MPELPEVEIVAQGLRDAGLVGLRIVDAEVLNPRTVAPSRPETFVQEVRNRKIVAIRRRAKYLVLLFEDGEAMLIHLRMTGRLHFAEANALPAVHDRIRLSLSDGRKLVFHDTRRFGRCRVATDPVGELAHLGPEPLEDAFTIGVLTAALHRHRRQLKPLLLDQRVVAGLGNIYVDESLWEARLNPQRSSETLTCAEIRRLHAAIRRVLLRGIAAQGTSLGHGRTNFYSVAGQRGENLENLRVFRQNGKACPRCGATILRCVVGQRGTHVCPRCQPG